MDLSYLPPMLKRIDAERQLYERPDASPLKRPQAPPQPFKSGPVRRKSHTAPTRPPPRQRGPSPAVESGAAAGVKALLAEPVAAHLRALTLIEAGTLDAADKLLEPLCHQASPYLPALLERALLHLRLGERRSGEHLLHELLQRARTRRNDEVLAAPEPMTVAFLRASAQAVLDQAPRGGRGHGRPSRAGVSGADQRSSPMTRRETA
jgi:hypothetical protein